jgi:hypothetical protein
MSQISINRREGEGSMQGLGCVMPKKNDPADIRAGPDENSSGKRVHCITSSCGKDFADHAALNATT